MISFLSKRRGATLAGLFSLALGGVVLLCGAGSVPIENLLPQGAMQGDLNAGGHNVTNAATIYATNVVVSGSLSTPSGFTLPFAQLTGTPTTLAGYGITDPIVLTSGSYANPAWITSLSAGKLTSGTLPNAQMPAPTTSALGGIEAASGATAHQYLTYVDTLGIPHSAQPSAGDISGLGTAATSSAAAFQPASANLASWSGVTTNSYGALFDASGAAAAAQAFSTNYASTNAAAIYATKSGATMTGATVNGVSLTAAGSSSQYLNGAGSYTTPSGSGGGVTSFNTRTGAVTLSNADITAATVSSGANAPVQIGATTTSYAGTGSGGNSALEVQLNNTVSGSAIPPINLTEDISPPDSLPISEALGVQSALFLHAGSNTNAAPGNVSAAGYRATMANRGTGAVLGLTGYETHLVNQTSSYGGGGTINQVTGFSAASPGADASDPIVNATGILISAQQVTGVTTGVAIDQEGTSDGNVFKAATDSIYGSISFPSSGGSDLGLYGSQKLAFWGATPIAQPSGDALTALSTEGLVTSPTLGGNDVNPFVCSSSSTVSNSTSATFITLGAARGTYTFAANKLVAGSTYVLHMAGYYSTTGTPTLALIFGTYSSGLGTTWGTTGNVTLPSSAANYEWEADYEFTVQSTGSSGTLIGQGWAHVQSGAGSVAVYPILNTSTVAINTTTSNSVLGFVQWGTAATGNTITCTNANFRQIY